MSQVEKMRKIQLTLNPGEFEWYNYLKRVQELHKKWIEDELNEKGYLSPHYKEMRDEELPQFEKDIFSLERKILEKPKPSKPIPQVNESDYAMEEQIKEKFMNSIGSLEQKQIDLQNKTMSFTFNEFIDIGDYFGEGYRDINSKLIKPSKKWGKDWTPDVRKRLVRETNRKIKTITNAIDNTPGLIQNTLVFHQGFFDVTKVAGDKVKFKTFVSASYQQNVANFMKHTYSSYPSELSYTYKILLPEGHKGLCANGEGYKSFSLARHENEQELLLNRGLEGTIQNIDYENHIVTLVVE